MSAVGQARTDVLRHGPLGRRPVLRRLASVAVLVLVSILGPLFLVSAGQAGAAGSAPRVSIVVNGQPVATSSDGHPVRLDPKIPAQVKVTVTAGASEVRVSTVKFQGQVMALPLFAYDSAVSLVVPPHRTRSVTFVVTLAGIGNEATGLIAANFTLLSSDGTAIASQAGVTDVNGSIGSLYGLFGLAVLLLTVTSLVFGLIGLARHQLSQNRWVRAVRFFIPGFGVGLVLIFTMSAFRLFDPGADHWLPLLVICSAVGLVGGFLTPAPDEEEFDDYDPDVLIAQIMIVDDDPLDVFAGQGAPQEPDRELVLSSVVRPTSVPAPSPRAPDVPDGRATTAPSPPSVPDGRATTAPATPSVPDSRATTAPATPSVPDSRATMAPPPSEPPDGEPHTAG